MVWQAGAVDKPRREAVTGGPGATVWLTGLSGSGKSTIASAVESKLVTAGRAAYVLDGDNLRHGINSDLGFSKEDRAENVRRVGEIAFLLSDAGLVALVPVISPYQSDRDQVRRRHDNAGLPFVEVFVDAPIDVCEARDPKGLYRRARAGEIAGMTGVDDPYEEPPSPDLHLLTAEISIDEAVGTILGRLQRL